MSISQSPKERGEKKITHLLSSQRHLLILNFEHMQFKMPLMLIKI